MSDEAPAVISVPGSDPLEAPVRPPTEGAPAADISKLLAKTGVVTYDPGFANTASCSSDRQSGRRRLRSSLRSASRAGSRRDGRAAPRSVVVAVP